MIIGRVYRASFFPVSWGLLLIAGLMVSCSDEPVSLPVAVPFDRYPATHESIAFTNLDFTIDSARSAFDSLLGGQVAAKALVSSLLTRSRFKNSFADLDEADSIAQRYVESAPASADAWLIKAEVDLALHRFVDAEAAIDRASNLGAPPDTITARRVTLLTATGRGAEVLPAVEARAKENPDFATLTQLAGVYESLGDKVRSEAAFTDALKAYTDVSPFAVAWVQFELAMLAVDSDPTRAVALFEEALFYLPSYVSARTDRAGAMAAAGNVDGAIAALMELSAAVDDPEPAGLLASLLIERGRANEAVKWRERAREGFEALLARHRQAFADHAAEFYLRVGEPDRALPLAEANLANRDTPRSRSLVEQARVALRD